MNDFKSNQNTHSPASRGDAHINSGVPLHHEVSEQRPPAEISRADESDAMATRGDAQASEANTDPKPEAETPWPPYGAAVLTTDEARLHLYKHHDIFLKERYTQKLVSEYKTLEGKPVPKPGGGMELQIAQASLDRYAMENPSRKNAADVPLDPKDKLFDQLRVIAHSKPYSVVIEGDAPKRSDTPTPAPQPTHEPPPHGPERNVEAEPIAPATPAPAQDMVPAALYDRVEQRLDTMEKLNTKLYETLDSTYDKLVTQSNELAKLTKQVVDKLESPKTILDSMTNTLKAASNIDGDRPLPTPMERSEPDEPPTRYHNAEPDRPYNHT